MRHREARIAVKVMMLSCWGISLIGCDDASASASSQGATALAAVRPASLSGAAASPWADLPVPPADGPRLAPVDLVTPVQAEPSKRSSSIGYLRLGARVARSERPVSRDGCQDGWFAIRPVGFVCADDKATTDLQHPLARVTQTEPNRANPMPYKYGFMRAIAPNYLRIPTKEEQLQYEMRLERHLRSYRNLQETWDALDVGANDVPLSSSGAAVGRIPEHALPMDMSVRYGGSGNDSVPWWLVGTRRVRNVSHFRAPTYAVMADRIKRHAGVAMIDSFVTGEKSGARRFAVTTDLRLIPADKIKASSGSPFHGVEIRDVGLPVAFPFANTTHEYQLVDGDLRQVRALPRRIAVPLTGKVRGVRGIRMVETRHGTWLRSQDLRTATKPSSLPRWARGKTKWIDISIASQVMTLWEGESPIYATLVSTGRGGLGEPGTPLITPRGTFRIYQKHVTTTMDSDVADSEFELRDVPWVMYFNGGFALHAAYWHDDFGRVRSHGCVNLAPIDARYVFNWSTPQVPDHWHGASAVPPFEEGTLVYVHA